MSGWIQGTGYTGEAGYEIFVPNADAPSLWRSLVNHGATPVGLGARDTLRLEKGYLLSGVDFCWPALAPEGDDGFLARDSWETNVPFGLDLNHDFIGKHRVVSHSETDERWWGIKYIEKGPLPRPGKAVHTRPLRACRLAVYPRVLHRRVWATSASVWATLQACRRAMRSSLWPVHASRYEPLWFALRSTEGPPGRGSWRTAIAGVPALRWLQVQQRCLAANAVPGRRILRPPKVRGHRCFRSQPRPPSNSQR